MTAKLIAALEDSALLDQTELDDLAELFLVPEPVISYPLAWLSPQWLDVDLADGTSRIHAIDDDTLARHPVSLKPPLRRCAAERAMRSDASRLRELLRDTELFAPRHRDALIHGLLDAGDVLDEASRRELIDRGLTAGQSSVRRAALERLCELDGADPALRRARNDPSASVRTWQPPVPQLAQSTLL